MVSILGPETAPEGDQKWDHFWNHVPPPLRESGVAFPGIVWEVCKGYWNWNYILQKKGRDIYIYIYMTGGLEGSRRSQEEKEGTRKSSQQEPGGNRRRQEETEEPGGLKAHKNENKPGGASRQLGEPGVATRKQTEPWGARGVARRS